MVWLIAYDSFSKEEFDTKKLKFPQKLTQLYGNHNKYASDISDMVYNIICLNIASLKWELIDCDNFQHTLSTTIEVEIPTEHYPNDKDKLKKVFIKMKSELNSVVYVRIAQSKAVYGEKNSFVDNKFNSVVKKYFDKPIKKTQ